MLYRVSDKFLGTRFCEGLHALCLYNSFLTINSNLCLSFRNSECHKCPYGGICAGMSVIQAKPNYWGKSSSGKVLKSPNLVLKACNRTLAPVFLHDCCSKASLTYLCFRSTSFDVQMVTAATEAAAPTTTRVTTTGLGPCVADAHLGSTKPFFRSVVFPAMNVATFGCSHFWVSSLSRTLAFCFSKMT